MKLEEAMGKLRVKFSIVLDQVD